MRFGALFKRELTDPYAEFKEVQIAVPKGFAQMAQCIKDFQDFLDNEPTKDDDDMKNIYERMVYRFDERPCVSNLFRAKEVPLSEEYGNKYLLNIDDIGKCTSQLVVTLDEYALTLKSQEQISDIMCQFTELVPEQYQQPSEWSLPPAHHKPDQKMKSLMSDKLKSKFSLSTISTDALSPQFAPTFVPRTNSVATEAAPVAQSKSTTSRLNRGQAKNRDG